MSDLGLPFQPQDITVIWYQLLVYFSVTKAHVCEQLAQGC